LGTPHQAFKGHERQDGGLAELAQQVIECVVEQHAPSGIPEQMLGRLGRNASTDRPRQII
jgi:hypothetical protein